MNQYFPYPSLKEGQQAIIDTIENNSAPIIIEAGTGSGKTVATMSALLEKRCEGEKILVFVRTINQMNPVLKEWAEIQNKTKGLTILPLLGKSRICNAKHNISKNTIIRCDSKLPYYKRTKLIKKLKSHNKRQRLMKWISWELVKQPTIDHFKKILSTRDNCPYHNSWSMLEAADIIVASYGYLKQLDRIEKEAGKSLNKLHIVVDEAHNFARERFYSIKKHHLLLFMKIFYKDNFLQNIYDEIRGLRVLTWEDILKSTEDPQNKINQVLAKVEHAKRLVRENSPFLKQLPEKLLQGNILGELLKIMKDIFSNYRSGSIIVSKDSFNIVDINPERIFNTLIHTKSLILQSGTMTPAIAFKKLYGLPKDSILLDLIERDIRKIRKDSKVFKAFYVSSLTSSSRFRNKEIYERYAGVIQEIFERSHSHILVLGPSYEFINEIARFIEEKMLIETRLSRTDAMHRGIINCKEKTIILGNQNGKIMEGNEWTIDGRSIVNTVVLTGLATRVPRDADEIILKHRTKILQDEYLASLFAQQIPLSIIAKQAFGRTRRHPEDRGAIIILDDRVDEFMQRNLWLSRYSSMKDLLEDYSEFFEDHNVLTDTRTGGEVC